MKSPALCRNRGSLLLEVIIALSIGAVFITSATTLSYIARISPEITEEKIRSLKFVDNRLSEVINYELEKDIPYISLNTKKLVYATGTVSLSTIRSDFYESFGKNTCQNPVYVDISEEIDISVDKIDMFQPIDNVVSDTEVRNSIGYIAMNSPVSSHSDFLVVDLGGDINSVRTLSSINTGPGASSVSIAGRYIYLANTSSVSQLQILDISDRSSPKLISTLSIPLPWATSTTPISSVVLYDKSMVYLGTEKWDGSELVIVSVENPYSPEIIGEIEIGTKVQDILVNGNTLYVGASGRGQMKIFNIEDKSNPFLINEISPVGWQTQEGKVIQISTSTLYLGRTVGGFNNTLNHEIFNISDQISSRDIPGGVYGIYEMYPWLFLITGKGEIDLWKLPNLVKDSSTAFTGFPSSVSCDRGLIYISSRDGGGVIYRVNTGLK